MYKGSKNSGAIGSGASDSGKEVPHDKGTKTISFLPMVSHQDLKSKRNIYK